MSQEPSQDAIDRARTEAYRLGLTPEQGEILLRTGKTPQQLQAEQAQRRAEIREDIQSFKNEQIGARLRGGELVRHEVRRTYDGGFVQKQTLLGERRPAIDTRSDIEIYKDVQAQLRSEGKTFTSPVQIRRDAATGQVREIRGRVAPRFSVGDVYLTTSRPRSSSTVGLREQFVKTRDDDSVFVAPDPLNPFNITAIPKSEARETSDGFEVSLDTKDPRLRLDQDVGYAAALSKTVRISPIKQAPQPSGDPIADAAAGLEVAAKNFLSDMDVFAKTATKAFGDFPSYFAAVFGDKRSRARTAESLYEIGDIGIKAERKTGPDVERDVIGTSFRGAADLITTGKTDVADDYTKIGENIIGNVPYALGGLAFSAATWLGPTAGVRLSRLGRAGTKAVAPRPRFDFDPRFGSFYDRPSVRFGPYNPTRWENPETLAELNKFRMTIDAPTVKDLIAPASLKGFEAFGAGSRSERATIETRSADRSLLLEKSLDEATTTPQMVDTKSFAVATEPTRTTSRTTSNLLGGGANIFTSAGNLGLFGETGAGRKRRRVDDIEVLIGGDFVPRVDSDLTQFAKEQNRGVITFRERDALDQGARFRGGQTTRDARAQQNLLAEYQKMLEGTMTKTDTVSMLGLSTETTQRQQQRAAQSQAAALSQMLGNLTGQATALTSMQSVRTTQAARRSFLGGFGFPVPSLSQRSRRKRKGKRGARFNELAYLAPDLVEIGYGKELAKAFNKAYGLSPDPYGPF